MVEFEKMLDTEEKKNLEKKLLEKANDEKEFLQAVESDICFFRMIFFYDQTSV